MPDRFKILEDSFSEDHPAPDDDGFQDFNAFARLSALSPVGDATSDTSAQSIEAKMVSAEAATPRGQEPSSPQPAAKLSSRTADHQSAAEALRSMRSSTIYEAAIPVSSARKAAQVRVEEDPLPWRKMSLREVFMLLRSATPETGASQPRLRGMFRR